MLWSCGGLAALVKQTEALFRLLFFSTVDFTVLELRTIRYIPNYSFLCTSGGEHGAAKTLRRQSCAARRIGREGTLLGRKPFHVPSATAGARERGEGKQPPPPPPFALAASTCCGHRCSKLLDCDTKKRVFLHTSTCFCAKPVDGSTRKLYPRPPLPPSSGELMMPRIVWGRKPTPFSYRLKREDLSDKSESQVSLAV